MSVRNLARRYYARQRSLARAAARSAFSVWADVDPYDIDTTWGGGLRDRAFVTIANGQQLAAASADEFVTGVLDEQGADSGAVGRVNASAFAGISSDGRSLETLLEAPAVAFKRALRRGETIETATASGRATLGMIATTQVADTTRSATAVSMAAHTAVSGYVRLVEPPACSRCVILAGRRYKTSEAFLRHPNCDCVNVPYAESEPSDVRVNPQAYFDSMTEAEQDKRFTAAGARAIREGADIYKVVNARRGASGLYVPGELTPEEKREFLGPTKRGAPRQRATMQRVDAYGRQVYVTIEGSGRRRAGSAGRAPKRTPRLLPEAVAELAGDDMDEYRRLLRRYGYLLD